MTDIFTINGNESFEDLKTRLIVTLQEPVYWQAWFCSTADYPTWVQSQSVINGLNLQIDESMAPGTLKANTLPIK